MIKKYLLSSLACTVVVAIPNAIITPLFYYDFLKNNSGLSPELWLQVQKSAEDTEVMAGIMSILLIGSLTTLIIHWTNAKTFASGLKNGFVFSALMMGVVNFGLLATTHYWSYLSAVTDIFVAAVTIAIGGGVSAVIMGRGKKA